MRGKLKKEGDYELYKTTEGHQILKLDNKNYYALVKGQKGDIIVHSDSDHKKSKTLSKGNYYYADFEDDPAFENIAHLFMEDGTKYKEILLPEGLPTEKDIQKKLIRSSDKLSKAKVKSHVKGKGIKGDEKQYEDKAEGLRDKTKRELYEMAKKKEINGRSNMDKAELVKKLSEKLK